MSNNCCVRGCNSSDPKQFFNFPKNEDLLNCWLREIPGIEGSLLNMDLCYICEDHFKQEDLILHSHWKELKTGSIPSNFDCFQIGMNSCRFCLNLTNVANKREIDEKVRSNFMELMGKELIQNEKYPNIICLKCNEDLKISANLKRLIKKSQVKLPILFKNSVIKEELNEEIVIAQAVVNNIKQESPLFITVDKSIEKSERPDRARDDSNKCKSEKMKRYCTKEKISCTDCGELMSSRRTYRRHQIKEHDRGILHICDICGDRRVLKSEIRKHMESKHMKNRIKFKCTHCEREFFRKDAWKEHVNAVHFNFVHICEICGLKFSTIKKYENHKRLMHTGEKPYRCTECEKAYATSSCLSEHKRRAHTESALCQFCSKMFPSADALSRHFKLSHRLKNFVCEFEGCLKKFANPSLLKAHSFVHSELKKFQCKICHHSYFKGADLNRHIKAAHMGIKLECEVAGCTSVFSRKDTLRYHLKSMHKNLDENYLQVLLENLRNKKLPNVKDMEREQNH